MINVRGATAIVAVCANLTACPVTAVDVSVSAFGTVGYAQSDQPYTYQRFIDDRGTFWRDSVGGLQVDAKFADQFGATVQVKVAPARDSDSEYEGTLSWAFLSWRPTNDWLFRAGKQRVAYYLYSQSLDVGVTYDFARLPTEMYSFSPDNEVTGFSFVKNWGLENGDLTLEGNWGKQNFDVRYWFRDGLPPLLSPAAPNGIPPGAVFRGIKVVGELLALSYKRDDDFFRIALATATLRLQNGGSVPKTYPFVMLPVPGVGYYQIEGPGVPMTSKIRDATIVLGAKATLVPGFRAIGEFAHTVIPQSGIDIANASTRGYVSLLWDVNQWTPYVYYAFLRSEPGQRNLYNAVNDNVVPDAIPNAALINASQRAGADQMLTYDQSSVAIGTAYSFSATSKIKAEYLRSHIGQMSSLVDGPPGSNIRNQNINVFSLSYSFAF